MFIGAGNLATWLAAAMQESGVPVVQVFSRTASSAMALASRLGCGWTNDAGKVCGDADLYVFAVRDDALASTVGQIAPNGGLWVHTAGSMSLGVFAGVVKRYGVLYPMQTFSRQRRVSFRNIPVFIEASSKEDGLLLGEIAGRLSEEVHFLSSEQRQQLHLAAVFASSFTNRMYAIAWRLLEAQGLEGRLLLPLIDETAAKVHDLAPAKAQTGPAVRHDAGVMKRHLERLGGEKELQELYRVVSRMIDRQSPVLLAGGGRGKGCVQVGIQGD